MGGYRSSFTIGDAVGCAVAAGFVLFFGTGTLFFAGWTCAHAPSPAAACSGPWLMLRLAAILLGGVGLFVLVRWVVDATLARLRSDG